MDMISVSLLSTVLILCHLALFHILEGILSRCSVLYLLLHGR